LTHIKWKCFQRKLETKKNSDGVILFSVYLMNTVDERLYSIEHGDEFKSKLVTSLMRDVSCLHCPDKSL
jgi:hypothetical protein